jgi:hypothetical protein
MQSRVRPMPAILIAVFPLVMLSCAAPAQFSRQSRDALQAGHADEAFELARKALAKDPQSSAARDAMSAAAGSIADGWKNRIHNIAGVDTIAAATYSREFQKFRIGLTRYNVTLAPDAAFAAEDAAIRTGAARIRYAEAEALLAAGDARNAYRQFVSITGFVSPYRDAAARAKEAYAQAVRRVAVLPFVNETGLPGLSDRVNAKMQRELSRHATGATFEFTQFVSPAEIRQRMTVAQTRAMSREEAIILGEDLNADCVVRGRFHSEREHTDRNQYHEIVVRRVMEKMPDGSEVARYLEAPFDAVLRERRVDVIWEMEIIDTHTKAAVANHHAEAKATAWTVWSDFIPTGNPTSYGLLPPAVRNSDPKRWAAAMARWKETFGDLTVPQLLDDSRNKRSRTEYRSSYRGEFENGAGKHPVFMDDLPSENDLAAIALEDIWQPVHQALVELDRKK